MTTINLLTLDRNLRKRGFVLGCSALGLAARGSVEVEVALGRVSTLRRCGDRARARFAVQATR